MRFKDLLDTVLSSRGITEKDIYKLLSSHILTDEEIFVISHLLDECNHLNVLFTRDIGTVSIRPRFFDIEVDYNIFSKTSQGLICSMLVNFDKETLYVVYNDAKVDIGLDLFDYRPKNTKNVLHTRMHLLNELLTRYYSRTLYAIYLELRRRSL